MPQQQRPNILLVMTDQQRFDTIQALGTNFSAETPTMDFLAREGITFDSCFCTAPICSPSRSTVMTGLFPSQAGMSGNLYAPCPPLNPCIPTIGKLFRNAGYETAYHGKWHMGGDVKDYGFEVGEETTHDETARLMASRFWRDRDWMENERPFCHVVSFINPHDHYFYDPDKTVADYQRPWKNLDRDVSNVPTPATNGMVDWPEERWGAYAEFYSEQLERLDKDLYELLHQFKTGGFYNNSWIIFTTDHGDMAGEHNLAFKGSYMYEGQVRIPLIIIPPMTRFAGADRSGSFKHDIETNKQVSALCSNIDILPTMLDIAGIEQPANIPGKSLLSHVKDGVDEDNHDCVFAEWHLPPIRMARTSKWKYVRYLKQGEELYDLTNDPHECVNLADNNEYVGQLDEMRERLDKHIAETKDPFNDLDKHEFIYNPSAHTKRGTTDNFKSGKAEK